MDSWLPSKGTEGPASTPGAMALGRGERSKAALGAARSSPRPAAQQKATWRGPDFCVVEQPSDSKYLKRRGAGCPRLEVPGRTVVRTFFQ